MALSSPALLSEDYFGYSYRELNWRYISGDPFSTNHSDWRYRYNAMGEREQKRLYHAPLSDSVAGSPYPWVQYILGGSKDQLAVWHGQQMTSLFCDTVKLRNVFLYPTEYITNGIGWNGVHEDITPIITRPDGSKEYRISDHLASLRVSLTNGSPTTYYDYDPWGNLLGVTTAPRRGFNDNEKDRENGLFSLGVRKYEEGRFLSVDVLFEKEPEISPYVYGGNAPLNFTDPGGKQREKFFMRSPIAFFGIEVAMATGAGMAGSGGVSAEPDGQSSGKFGSLGLRPSSMEHSSGVTYTKVGAVPQNFLNIGRSTIQSAVQRPLGATNLAPYKRPSGSTTPAQRKSVQGKPCVDCGATASKMHADHKEPLVKEYYETGTIDKVKMRSLDAVQPQCPDCSNRQGAELSKYSREMKKLHEPSNPE